MTCSICARAIDGESIALGGGDVHGECVVPGLLREVTLAVAELLAVVAAPVIVVWAG